MGGVGFSRVIPAEHNLVNHCSCRKVNQIFRVDCLRLAFLVIQAQRYVLAVGSGCSHLHGCHRCFLSHGYLIFRRESTVKPLDSHLYVVLPGLARSIDNIYGSRLPCSHCRNWNFLHNIVLKIEFCRELSCFNRITDVLDVKSHRVVIVDCRCLREFAAHNQISLRHFEKSVAHYVVNARVARLESYVPVAFRNVVDSVLLESVAVV